MNEFCFCVSDEAKIPALLPNRKPSFLKTLLSESKTETQPAENEAVIKNSEAQHSP